jgi:ketosteroid isomerase-like protein
VEEGAVGGDNQATIQRIRQIYESGSLADLARGLDELAAEDFVQEWPQSGERMTRDGARQINENYAQATGNEPTFTMRRIVGEGDVHVIEGTVDYGDGIPVSYAGIMELGDGKVRKLTEYYANPFEPPAWRAEFVGRMEPARV